MEDDRQHWRGVTLYSLRIIPDRTQWRGGQVAYRFSQAGGGMITNTTAPDLNGWIRLVAKQYDSMNDYYPGTLWIDTDTGTYGDARTLVLISTTGWSQEDCDAWECMTDSERNRYGLEYDYHNGQCLNPLEYQRETGGDN